MKVFTVSYLCHLGASSGFKTCLSNDKVPHGAEATMTLTYLGKISENAIWEFLCMALFLAGNKITIKKWKMSIMY